MPIELVALMQDAADTVAIADIEQQLARAWLTGDRAFIEAILAPDWAVTDAAGRRLTKQQVIDETFASADRQIESMTVDEVQVRVFGDSAVATGRTRAVGSYQGQSASVTLRFTDVLIRRNGRWQFVASHGSTVVR
ncbi:MAG: nuclear transport factor 2 family protein [Acidobacteria bacterium]|nr:nuclear transport factor 2 family protein [Acidobacteriota bacterium]